MKGWSEGYIKIGTRTILLFSLIIQVAVICLVLYNIPLLTQCISFIYLSLVPGVLLLRILKINEIALTEFLLYAFGTSISLLIVLGLFINNLCPIIGISNPISRLPVVFSFSLFILAMCCVCYVWRRDDPYIIKWGEKQIKNINVLLYLCLLPLIAILGAYLVNVFNANYLLLSLLGLIAITTCLITFDIFIPKECYPLAIYTTSLAILYHKSLITSYLYGCDIQFEYHFAQTTLDNSRWLPQLAAHAHNAMLAVTILPPVYSIMLHMSIVWVYKVIYPLFFSLVPLALYEIYKKILDAKSAYLSVFFFMSYFAFFSEMLGLPRQQIAELFLVLLLLLITSGKNVRDTSATTLFLLFSFSLIWSHYSISYFFALYLVITLIFMRLDILHKLEVFKSSRSLQGNLLSANYVTLYMVFLVVWYMYIAYGTPFSQGVSTIARILTAIPQELFDPLAREQLVLQGAGLQQMEKFLNRISQYLHLITAFFILLGIINWITGKSQRIMKKIDQEFGIMVILSLTMLLFSLLVPFFTSAFGVSRLYHITLFFLAPFCITGGIAFFSFLRKILIKILRNNECFSYQLALKLVAVIVLIPYFLFSTGFAHTVSGVSYNPSIALGFHKVDSVYFVDQEVCASRWLSDVYDNGKIFADLYGTYVFRQDIKVRSLSTIDIPHDSYLYLRWWNVKHKKVLLREEIKEQAKLYYVDVGKIVNMSEINRLYDNGGSQVLQINQ